MTRTIWTRWKQNYSLADWIITKAPIATFINSTNALYAIYSCCVSDAYFLLSRPRIDDKIGII